MSDALSRRGFLGLVGLGAGSLALGVPLDARAESPAMPTRPLWLHLSAGGGWDVNALCDPRPGLYATSFNVGQTSNTSEGHSFSYADLGGSAAPFTNNNGFEFAAFFETWAEQLLVVNGVYTSSASHRSGGRLAASGRMASGYPALTAMIAAADAEGRSMPFMAAGGGYNHAQGLVATTRLGHTKYLAELAHPNGFGAQFESIYREEDLTLLQAARQARLERLKQTETRPHVLASLLAFEKARQGSASLAAYKEAFDAGAVVPLPPASKQNRPTLSVFEQGFKAMIGYEQGLTCAASIQAGGFDTHDQHDSLHLAALQGLLNGVDLLMKEAEVRQIPLVIVINSEFGRTAEYNVSAGKDHWPVTSWMLLQSQGLDVFAGGRVVGASALDASVGHVLPVAVDPQSLQLLPAGEFIYPGGLHLGLRALAQIDQLAPADSQFPITNLTSWAKVFSG